MEFTLLYSVYCTAGPRTQKLARSGQESTPSAVRLFAANPSPGLGRESNFFTVRSFDTPRFLSQPIKYYKNYATYTPCGR